MGSRNLLDSEVKYLMDVSWVDMGIDGNSALGRHCKHFRDTKKKRINIVRHLSVDSQNLYYRLIRYFHKGESVVPEESRRQ